MLKTQTNSVATLEFNTNAAIDANASNAAMRSPIAAGSANCDGIPA